MLPMLRFRLLGLDRKEYGRSSPALAFAGYPGIINANATARLILGLSKCGMHGEEPVRLKRLKRPWVDED